MGSNVLEMCQLNYPPDLLAMLQAQAKGTQVHGIALRGNMNVRLVPEWRHETLLSSQDDYLHHAQVFGDRINDVLGAEHMKVVPTKATNQQQMIVLRAVVMTGPNKAKGGGCGVAATACLLVKVWNDKTDVGFMPGLKLGAVFAAELITARHPWAPFTEVRQPNHVLSCGANIVLRGGTASEPAASMTLQQPAAAQSAAQASGANPRADAAASTTIHADGSAAISCSIKDASADQQSNVLMERVDDPFSDKRPPAKRSKRDRSAHLKIEFPSTTCVSTSSVAQIRAIRTTQFEQFVNENVLGGLATEADPDIAGLILRQFQGNLRHNVYSF